MPDVWFAIPGDPETLTGGYVYARHLKAALAEIGWTVHPLALSSSFPDPSPGDLEATRQMLALLPAGAVVLFDGLAFGALPPALLEGLPLRIAALVHHPLALETGLSPTAATHLKTSERAALRCASAVIVPSPETARILAEAYEVPGTHLHVAAPGTAPAARARGTSTAPVLLTVGTLTPRKGHDVLVKALARIADLPWTSRFVGSLARDPATTGAIKDLIAALGLTHRIALAGEAAPARLRAIYGEADGFVLASHYEGYGMVFAEALAHGLPIVGCAGGAVAETVPRDAGLLVPPGDDAALAAALRRVLTEPGLRTNMADAAWHHGQQLPRWSDTARIVAVALDAAARAAA